MDDTPTLATIPQSNRTSDYVLVSMDGGFGQPMTRPDPPNCNPNGR